jgi:peroxiredoxin Q/BCP
MLTPGTPAPRFSLEDDSGMTIRLEDFVGRKVVLYFYPRDNTPGCTVEACAFRDAYDQFLDKGAVVIGMSADSTASHATFRAKHGLPFHLLADPEKNVLKAYGVWKEKSFMGKTGMGIVRSTVIIDEQGIVSHVFPEVSPKDHVSELLAALT